MLPCVVARETVVGVRRLPVRALRRKRYEVRYRDGGAASCSFSRLDAVLEAKRVPADFWALVGAADEAFRNGDGHSLFDWPTGSRRESGEPGWGPDEGIRTRGRWVTSSLGYRVRATGRAGLDYEDSEGPLHIDSEWMASPTLVIYRTSIPDHRPDVLGRAARLWLCSGFDVDVDPPDALG
jgi:hypothetical protein